jgi:hypothetical protein
MKHKWSFSALKNFKGCSRRYHAVYVLKLYPHKDTEATLYGKEVHKAMEDYIRDGKPLPNGLGKFKQTADWVRSRPGTVHCEYEMGLDVDKQPTEFSADNVWVRGIADVLVVDGKEAFCLDWKTGSAKYPDKDQLELMALMTFAHFPEVEVVKGSLVFLHHDKLVKGKYLRSDMDNLWKRWDRFTDVLDRAYELDKWYPNPTPLCRFCPYEFCEYWVR